MVTECTCGAFWTWQEVRKEVEEEEEEEVEEEEEEEVVVVVEEDMDCFSCNG